jgi:hypothetical protein
MLPCASFFAPWALIAIVREIESGATEREISDRLKARFDDPSGAIEREHSRRVRSNHPLRQESAAAADRLYVVFTVAFLAEGLHNFVGPLFIVCIILLLATFKKARART